MQSGKHHQGYVLAVFLFFLLFLFLFMFLSSFFSCLFSSFGFFECSYPSYCYYVSSFFPSSSSSSSADDDVDDVDDDVVDDDDDDDGGVHDIHCHPCHPALIRCRAVIGSPAAQQMAFWLCGI